MTTMLENRDYQFIPARDAPDNDQAWDIRILTGEFNETVIRFGNVQLDGKNDELHFNFAVILAPSDYITLDNADLQETAGLILESIILQGFEDGSAIIDERK